MRERFYLAGFVLVSAVLIYLGRDLLQSSLVVTGALTFGGVTAASVLMLLLYRVKLELQDSRNELARKESELNLAREVQRALFPASLPSGRGLEYHGVCIPARGISGDYYDAFELSGGRQAFAIADISGKGISAALLMANLQALLRTEVYTDSSPGELARRLNRRFHQVSPPVSFATFFYGQWDPAKRLLSYVNAGHNLPVLFRNGDTRQLEEGGVPLGIFSDADYQRGELLLEPDDLLLLYSDGVTEACPKSHEEFGCDRLVEVVQRHRQRPAPELAEQILDSVRRWAGDELQDDQTLLLVQVVESGNSKGDRDDD